VPQSELNATRVEYYKTKLRAGQHPTALAVTIFDGRVPMGSGYNQHAIAHFLLDGHHKVMAASQLGEPISLLSFLAYRMPREARDK
jgi:hypothetical protein